MAFLFSKLGVKPVLAACALGVLPTAAFAHQHEGVHIDLRVGIPPVIVTAPAPVYETREVRVWVDPVYRTVCDRVWVPDRFEFRDVVHYRYHRQWIERERVLASPGHFEDVARQELVTPGHWETRFEQVRVG
jgi:hypothetical protein